MCSVPDLMHVNCAPRSVALLSEIQHFVELRYVCVLKKCYLAVLCVYDVVG